MARRSLAALLAFVVWLVAGCETEPSGSGEDEAEAPQVCKDYCDLEVSCDQVDRQECEDGCTDFYISAAATGGFCPQSFQDLFACVAALDCSEYDAWLHGKAGETYPCSELDSAYEINCP